MCRLLIYQPGSARSRVPPPLIKLGMAERTFADLAAGILWGAAGKLPLIGAEESSRVSSAEVACIAWPLASAPVDTLIPLWQALGQVADYGRLILVKSGATIHVRRVLGDEVGNGAALADDGYLYQPHPGRLISGRYCEVFAPTDPDALICACVLGEMTFWDDEEQQWVAGFRRELVTVLTTMLQAADVIYIDSDGWYAEL